MASPNIITQFETKFGDLLRVVGIVLTMQGVIAQYLTGLGIQSRVLAAVFGGLGIFMAITGKYIDSKSYTAIQSAKIAHDAWAAHGGGGRH